MKRIGKQLLYFKKKSRHSVTPTMEAQPVSSIGEKIVDLVTEMGVYKEEINGNEFLSIQTGMLV